MGERDEADELEGVGGVMGDFLGEGAAMVVPAEERGAAPEFLDEGAAGDGRIDKGAPNVEQQDDGQEGEDDKEARDRWLKLEHE